MPRSNPNTPRRRRTYWFKTSQPDFRVEKTTRLLNENSSRSVAEVAGACALSSSRLSHLFRAELGTSVGKFRKHLEETYDRKSN